MAPGGGQETGARSLVHGLTIDLEDWSDTQAVRRFGRPAVGPVRIEASTALVLDLLARHGARATFFVLGSIARDRPALVRGIAAAGHRIGSHGFSHRPVSELRPDSLHQELRETRTALEDTTGVRVQAHRCPSWSLRPGTLWALPVIAQCGFVIDASLSPAGTPRSGTAGVPRCPFRVRLPDGRELREFPLAVGPYPPRVPFAGGFFLRTLPAAWVHGRMREFTRAGRPAVVYAHPWEFDPQTPRGRMPQPWHFLQHHGLGHMPHRFADLLTRYRFAPLEELSEALPWERSPIWSPPARLRG